MGGPVRENDVSLLVGVPRGVKLPRSMGWFQGRAARKLPLVVSMKSSPRSGHGGIGGSRNAPSIGDASARRWRVGSGGAIDPDLPEGIDGCRESEVSREWLTGDTVYWFRHGLNALTEPRPGGCNGGAQRSPCQDGFVLQNTSCVSVNLMDCGHSLFEK